MIAIDTLTKTFGRSARGHRAVDQASFTCEPGTVTGFLGPNGAGKSTTLRILTGLTAPDTGSATIGGRAYGDIANPGRQVGAVLDASAHHGGRTGTETLRLGALVMGVDRSRISEVLDLVGLTSKEARRRVGDYSLGMRQRLALAHALLGDPGVLILDEPANGLDPAGIHWLRQLLRAHADRGGTVLLSSHLLREVEAVADRIVLIGQGRILSSGPTAELLAGTGTRVLPLPEHREALLAAVDQADLTATSTADDGLVIAAGAEDIARLAAAHQIILTEIRPADGQGIEEMFLELTAAGAREQIGAQV